MVVSNFHKSLSVKLDRLQKFQTRTKRTTRRLEIRLSTQLLCKFWFAKILKKGKINLSQLERE